MTTGVGIGSRRFRSADPSSHASAAVKCSNIKEESIWDMDSSCSTGQLCYSHTITD
jgi:hypothetical protein